MQKHFTFTITNEHFEFARNEEKIQAEAALDGLYVVRTSVDAKTMNADQVVAHYKSLSRDDRIRGHVFICMLAYYVEWHIRQQLREVLFDDCDPHTACAPRRSAVD